MREHGGKVTQIFIIHLTNLQKSAKRDKDLTVFSIKLREKGGKDWKIVWKYRF